MTTYRFGMEFVAKYGVPVCDHPDCREDDSTGAIAEACAHLRGQNPKVNHARLDADRAAKPLTSLVAHARAGDCIGPFSAGAEEIRHEDGSRIKLK